MIAFFGQVNGSIQAGVDEVRIEQAGEEDNAL